MTWQLLLTISVVTYSVSTLLQRILIKDEESDPVAYSIVFQLLTGVIIGAFAIFKGFSIPPLAPLIPNLFIMTVLYGTATVLAFKALKESHVSEFTIMLASRSLWIVAGAVVFLGEQVQPTQLAGTLLIIVSIAVISWNKKSLKLGRGAMLSLLAAFCFGFAFINDAVILRSFEVPSYLTIAFMVPALAVWACNPRSTKNVIALFKRSVIVKLFFLVTLYAVSALSIFSAYQIGQNASQIAPLNQTSVILTVLLSAVFLGEREGLFRKVLGACISFVGLILVS